MDGHKYTALFEAPGGQPIVHAYPDPITRGSPFTIGLGHTGKDIQHDTVWTYDQCIAAFYSDYSQAIASAAHIVGTGTWAKLCEPRQAVFTDMAFNIGPGGLANFSHMLVAAQFGDWQKAHDELLDSSYASQVKSRAQANAKILLTGEWPNEAG